MGSLGACKGLNPGALYRVGGRMLCGNTLHLWLGTGQESGDLHVDLHNFMRWKGPFLTDSRGFKVFSLGDLQSLSAPVSFARAPYIVRGSPHSFAAPICISRRAISHIAHPPPAHSPGRSHPACNHRQLHTSPLIATLHRHTTP
ncbi:tRNA-guanine transglycosylase, partial [Salmonella enterica]|uniref:tRNA-guanine transglycosylase n=1 Tax=Salmonella enterica TaxID=28901 RepID=UPI00398C402E